MNEQLTVKNFGPIKDATVDFKRVTVFIGPTGGGKSTLAKLAAVFRDLRTFAHDDEIFINRSVFKEYSIKSYFKHNTVLAFERRNSFGIFTEDRLDRGIIEEEELEFVLREEAINESRKRFYWLEEQLRITEGESERKELKIERLVLLANKLEHDVDYLKIICPTIPAYISNYLRMKYKKTSQLSKILIFPHKAYHTSVHIDYLLIDFLKIRYDLVSQCIEGLDNSYTVPLDEASNSIQSVTPMLVLLEHLSRQKEQAQSFIIEEPELNLYPTAQQGLMNWLVEKCTAGENDLTITTHSPYILASCNLLMEAYKVWQDRPELEAEIEKIVPRASWINPEEFAAYYVADGTVRSIKDERTDLIGGNELDAVSGEISDSFRRLLRLKKQPA